MINEDVGVKLEDLNLKWRIGVKRAMSIACSRKRLGSGGVSEMEVRRKRIGSQRLEERREG